MEILITLIVLTIIFSIGFLVGNKQLLKKENGYEQRWDDPTFPNKTLPTSSLDEVPAEFLMGGDIDRALHVAGVKEATPAKLAEWENERRVKVETKTELSVDSLLSKLNKTDLQIKAGIIENTDKTGADIKIQVKEIDASDEISFRIETARKEADRAKTEYVKRNFEALPLSRLSVEGMNKIIEFVREDIQNQVKEIEKNTPISVKNLMNPETVHTALASITIKKPKRKYTKKTK